MEEWHGSSNDYNELDSGVFQLIHILGLHIPPADESKRCVVLVGPHEHHSNMLPWREAPGCEVRYWLSTTAARVDLLCDKVAYRV